MALLNFKNVLLFFIKLVLISETVCIPGVLFGINLFSNSLHYVSKKLYPIQPQFSLQKLLIPETYPSNNIVTRPSLNRNNVSQKLTTPASYTEINIEEKYSSTETSNSNNNDKQNPRNETNDIDERWNSFFNEYFKNQTLKSDLSTTDNINSGSVSDIFDDQNTENISYDIFTDTTDTTLFDNETSTDDLLRNGVPPEVLSSLLG